MTKFFYIKRSLTKVEQAAEVKDIFHKWLFDENSLPWYLIKDT